MVCPDFAVALAQVWEHRQTHQHVSTLLDPSLDHSGFIRIPDDQLYIVTPLTP